MAFNSWAAAAGITPGASAVRNWLLAIVEADPIRIAVNREDDYGTAATQSYFVLTLDAGGGEIARAPGYYIDRIAAGTYIVDESRATVNDAGDGDPLYGVSYSLAAVDPNGNQLWTLLPFGFIELSNIFRLDADHWIVAGSEYNTNPQVTYFDASGQTSTPPPTDTRACEQQESHWCLPASPCGQ
jgi:hypothetical protein